VRFRRPCDGSASIGALARRLPPASPGIAAGEAEIGLSRSRRRDWGDEVGVFGSVLGLAVLMVQMKKKSLSISVVFRSSPVGERGDVAPFISAPPHGYSWAGYDCRVSTPVGSLPAEQRHQPTPAQKTAATGVGSLARGGAFRSSLKPAAYDGFMRRTKSATTGRRKKGVMASRLTPGAAQEHRNRKVRHRAQFETITTTYTREIDGSPRSVARIG